MRLRDTVPRRRPSQLLDGWRLAGHLGILDRPCFVDFDVYDPPWGDRHGRYTPAQLAELWRRQLATPGVASDYPVGIYFHVPFCTHTCSFCRCFRLKLAHGRNFLDRFVDFVCAQMDFFAPLFHDTPIRYFSVGGGTPSILSPAQLRRLFTRFHERFEVRAENPVNTFEMSVPTAHDATLDVLAEFGIPRISMGVQTLQPVTRRSSAMFAIEPGRLARRVRSAQARGIHCNLDLVLGLRDETAAQFLENFRALMEIRPDSVIVNLLDANYFADGGAAPSPDRVATMERYLEETGAGMAAAAAQAGYAVYPHGNTVEAVGFFSPEFDRAVQPHWDVFKRLASGANSLRVGTSVFALGSVCNLALVPDYLIACFDQDYEFVPDKVMYQCARKEVYSILYPREEDSGPLFSREQQAVLQPLIERLERSRKVEVRPSLQDVVVEFEDAGQHERRGQVVIQPFQDGRPHYRRAGEFALSHGGTLTPKTEAVLGAVQRWLADAAAE
ncbi:MAG: radical SAM protein [Deltaproteobacteria bacterium]|nr:radical SAM protein [Deltaproteobacteria bacterium]